MAAAFSSLTANFCLGFRHLRSPNDFVVFSLPQTPAKIRQSNRLGSDVGGLPVNHGLQKVFASGGSARSSNTDKGKVSSSSSNVADAPPLQTILAGIMVFLLFFWVLGSIIMWTVGLIVNAPS